MNTRNTNSTVADFLFAIIFLILLPQGMSQCSLGSMTIHQTKTHKYVKNKPVWKVKISNNCYCSQLDVRVSCKNFQTVKPIKASVLTITSRSKGHALALINGGQPIYPYSSFSFTYAWSSPFRFRLVSSQVACSY